MPLEHASIPDHLYNDIIGLYNYLEEQAPADSNRSRVTQANIDAMEAKAGFPLPALFKDFWLQKGSVYWEDKSLSCLIYAYTDYGTSVDTLYNMLWSFLNLHNKKSIWIELEEELLSACWVLGMIRRRYERWFIVSDPLGNMHKIHINVNFSNINDDLIKEAITPLLAIKSSLSAFIPTAPPRLQVELQDNEDDDDDFEEDDDDAATLAFLKEHNLEVITYSDALSRLGLEKLFDFWEDENAGYARHIGQYEDERAYFTENNNIFFCHGDLHIKGDLEIPDASIDLLIVTGNMTIEGKVSGWYEFGIPYYVTGNSTIDYLRVAHLQKTKGLETVRYLALAWADEHEMLRKVPHRKINAPVFLSWFYDLNRFEFSPDTLIVALYDYEDVMAYQTNNAFLPWHDFASAFRSDLYYPVYESHHDNLNLNIGGIYEALKNNEPILADGVTIEGIKLMRKGRQLQHADDSPAAYECFTKAIAISPGYYLAYYAAGKCLLNQKDYTQAKALFEKGISLQPEKLRYETGCAKQAAVCAAHLGA